MFHLHMAAIAPDLQDGSSGFHQPSRQLRVQHHHVIAHLGHHMLAQNALLPRTRLRARSGLTQCPIKPLASCVVVLLQRVSDLVSNALDLIMKAASPKPRHGEIEPGKMQ